MPSEAVATTLQVTQILEMLGIPYAIGGSMASTTHGRVRATDDVDIVADLQQQHVNPLLAQLGDDSMLTRWRSVKRFSTKAALTSFT